ncbi:DUF3139 domain-containing protein [Staphylococcus sp. Marseille-Q6910]|uniref:DUF3139 domain-containing protein n=1 Tax=Staphylococcus sp. Marseille-Q6910 TaxID=2937990 RepID=UPI002557F6ED|nr:DUF3139 domain-containing protein [Staphylococcus sp. Marseille-Q6910]
MISIVVIILIIALVVIIYAGKHMYLNYQKHEEAKIKEKVHRVLKKKGWEKRIKTEEPTFTLNTGYNYLEVTYKDEPYNTYQYDVDDNGKITGDANLKDKYNKYWNNKKKREKYKKRHHFDEKYDLK